MKSLKMTTHSDPMVRMSFFVPGRPATAGSKSVFRNPKTKHFIVVDACKHGKPWRLAVQKVAKEEMDGSPIVKKLPIAAEFEFVLKRSKSHYRTGKYSDELITRAPMFHLQPPDVDKMSRAILDALTNVVYQDDCQVIKKTVNKRWAREGEEHGAHVTIEVIG